MTDKKLKEAMRLNKKIEQLETDIHVLLNKDKNKSSKLIFESASKYASYHRIGQAVIDKKLTDKICDLILRDKEKELNKLNKEYNEL